MLTGFGYLGATARAGQSTPPGDTTPPVLSGASVTPGTTTSSLDISTDEGNGTLYWMVSTNASETAAAVKAGGGLDSGSQAVSSPGAQPTIDAAGLTADTAYFFHAMHEDAANNQSAVSSTSFTTEAVASIAVAEFASNGDASNGTSGSTVTTTAGASGIVALCFGVCNVHNNVVITRPDGFTDLFSQVSSGMSAYVGFKRLTSAENSFDLDFGTNIRHFSSILLLSGVDDTTQIDVASTSDADNGDTLVAPGHTPVTDQAFNVLLYSKKNNGEILGILPPAGYTELAEITDGWNGTFGVPGYVARKVIDPAAATGDQSIVTATAAQWRGYQVSFRPAA